MNRRRVFIFAAILQLVCCQAVPAAEAPAAVDPKDAVVLIIMHSVMGRFVGSGFVIGDGTLVVTAHHLVFEKSKKGLFSRIWFIYEII